MDFSFEENDSIFFGAWSRKSSRRRLKGRKTEYRNLRSLLCHEICGFCLVRGMGICLQFDGKKTSCYFISKSSRVQPENAVQCSPHRNQEYLRKKRKIFGTAPIIPHLRCLCKLCIFQRQQQRRRWRRWRRRQRWHNGGMGKKIIY